MASSPRVERLREQTERHRRVIGLAAAAVALCLAALWTAVVPEGAGGAPAGQEFVIRWGHAGCWLLLAGAAVAWACSGPRSLIQALLGAAGVAYVVFLAAVVF